VGGTARHAGIGVEGEDKTNARRRRGRTLARGQERGIGCAAQQAVELVQLAALAFPSHPAALARVPDAAAVEEQEARASAERDAVALIEARDAGAGGGQQDLIAGGGRGG